jgi:hypothetical protein
MSRLRPVYLVLGLFILCVVPVSAAPVPPSKVPKELLEARVKAASDTYKENEARVRGGQGLPSELFGWSRRWLDAELALGKDKAARLAALQTHVKRTREVERILHAFSRTGQGRHADATAATYYRVQAEILLIEAGGELPKPNKEDKPVPEKKSP